MKSGREKKGERERQRERGGRKREREGERVREKGVQYDTLTRQYVNVAILYSIS